MVAQTAARRQASRSSLSSGYTVMFCGSRKDEVFIMATGNSKKGVIAILTGGGDVPGLNSVIKDNEQPDGLSRTRRCESVYCRHPDISNQASSFSAIFLDSTRTKTLVVCRSEFVSMGSSPISPMSDRGHR